MTVFSSRPPHQRDKIASRLSATTPNKLTRYRTGVGEPLVLLHGIGESVVGWQPVHDALSKDYDVIAVDLPGFGRSPSLPPGGGAHGGGLGGCR